MTRTRQDILDRIVSMLQDLAKDWDYSAPVGPATRLFADLGFESLDAVVLGTAIQERYQQQMPFAELLADVGQRSTPDLTVGELAEFVEAHVSADVQEAR
jgi:acyl carrier protein